MALGWDQGAWQSAVNQGAAQDEPATEETLTLTRALEAWALGYAPSEEIFAIT